jgi:tetratricopeptide (TPR) repeat protein
MRSVLLTVLAVVGVLVSVRLHLADRQYRLGREAQERGDDPAKAAARLEAAYDIDSGDAHYALRIGRAKLETGTREGVEEATGWFRTAARRNPLMARAQFWWGVALVALDREDEAVERFETARRLTPYNVDLNRRIAGYYMERWERTRSRDDLRRAFEAYHALRLVEPEVTSEAVLKLLTHPLVSYADLDSVVPRNAAERETLAETLASARRFAWAIRAFDEADDLAGAGGRLKVRGRIFHHRHLAEEHPVAALDIITDAREVALASKDGSFPHDAELGLANLRVSTLPEVDEKERAAARGRALQALKRHFTGARRGVAPAIAEIAALFRELPREDAETAKLEVDFWSWLRTTHRTLEAAPADLHLAEAILAEDEDENAADAALSVLKRFTLQKPSSAKASYLYALCYRRIGRIDLARKHLQMALRLRPEERAYRDLARDLSEEEGK